VFGDVLNTALAFIGLLAVIALVWFISRPNTAREEEDAARAYFDAHGRWPDDPAA
jgi:hypothetical protein